MDKLKQDEQACIDVKDSAFDIFGRMDNVLEIVNAAIFWRNFSARPDQYGKTQRTFCVAVPFEIAKILEERGWTVKQKKLERHDIDGNLVQPVVVDEKGEAATLYYIRIKVSMESEWPPVIKRISSIQGKVVEENVNLQTISELDSDTILDASVTIKEYINKKTGRATGYLSTLTAVTDPGEREADFGGRYDDPSRFFGNN